MTQATYPTKDQVIEANTRTVYRQFVKLTGHRNAFVKSLPPTKRWDAMDAADRKYWVERYGDMQRAITTLTRQQRKAA